MKEGVELRVASLDDMRQIWRLCSRHFGEYRGSTAEEFESLCHHRWLNNPARTDAHVLGWVLENEDRRIVGFLGSVPQRFKIGERIEYGASGTSWCVDPPYRACSLELYKKNLAWGDRHFLLDTTAGKLASRLHQTLKLGMRPIPVSQFGQRFFWVMKPHRLLDWRIKKGRLLKFPVFFHMLSGVLYLRFIRNRKLHFKTKLLRVTAMDDFTDEFEAFWENNKQDFPVTLVRDKAFLKWRYQDVPVLGGRFFTFCCRENDGKLMGYVVVHHKGYRNRKEGHYLSADLFYQRDRQDVFLNLMNAAFQFVKNQGGAVLEISGFHSEVMRVLRRQRPWIRKFPEPPYWYKAENNVFTGIGQSEAWWPSAVDGDLNI